MRVNEAEEAREPMAEAPCGHVTCRLAGPCQGRYSDGDNCPACAVDWKVACECELPPSRYDLDWDGWTKRRAPRMLVDPGV